MEDPFAWRHAQVPYLPFLLTTIGAGAKSLYYSLPGFARQAIQHEAYQATRETVRRGLRMVAPSVFRRSTYSRPYSRRYYRRTVYRRRYYRRRYY